MQVTIDQVEAGYRVVRGAVFTLSGTSDVDIDRIEIDHNGGGDVRVAATLRTWTSSFTLSPGRNEFKVSGEPISGDGSTDWFAVQFIPPIVKDDVNRLLHMFPRGLRS